MKRNSAALLRGVGVGLLVLVSAVSCARAANVAALSGSWSDSGVWSAGHVPVAGEDVVIPSGKTVTNSSVTALLGSLTNSGTLVFDGWSSSVTATNISISGTVKHLANTDTLAAWVADHRILFLCTNLVVTATGFIDAHEVGYGYVPGGSAGYGPGGGISYGGGAYGGRGGGANGGTYGSAAAPTDPGSGGGAQWNGAGGGAVRIQAYGAVTVDGTISANGGNGNAGGGSGGSIYISCHTFHGTSGALMADGGSGNQGSGCGGGGGRIAVVYDITAQAGQPLPSIRYSAARGTHRGGLWSKLGDIGTLYFPDSALIDRTLVPHAGELIAPGFTHWSTDSLTFSNSALRLPQDGFALTVSNALTVTGDNIYLHRTELTNAVVTCGSLTVDKAHMFLYRGMTSGVSLTCGADLIVTNTGCLSIYGGVTNGLSSTNDGAIVTVANGLVIASGSWVYSQSHPVNGGSPFFQVGDLAIDSGGGMEADANGFGPGVGPGRGSGFGGGSYGGKGSGTTLGTYGSPTNPVQAGSGAGDAKSAGGGLIHVAASGEITVNGTISAEGASLRSGASGGGIHLRCRAFRGTGALSAKGGNAGTEGGTYAGGGGRIAVWRADDFSALSVTNVDGGWHQNGTGPNTGEVGTVSWGQLPAPPLIANEAPTNVSYNWANLNGSLTSTGSAATTVWAYWGLTDGGITKGMWSTNNGFGVMTAGTASLTTNITDLISGTNYYYRFYASNVVGDVWADSTTNFATPFGVPTVSNSLFGATNVTLVSAYLNGYLVATGTASATVSVLWGPSDAGTNSGAAWAYTNDLSGYRTIGPQTSLVSLPASNTFYYYRYRAQNAGGVVWAEPASVFMAGEVSVQATAPNASETGPTPGTITVSRAVAVTGLAITVSFSIGGTADPETDYGIAPTGTNVVMGAGVSNVALAINPVWDDDSEPPESVTVTLVPGQYAVAPMNSATVMVADAGVVPGSNGTVRAGEWSVVTNWTQGRPPVAGDDVYLYHDTSITNASRPLSSLTVGPGATLTFYGTNRSATATDITVDGTVTHPVNTDTTSPYAPNHRVWLICTNLTVTSSGHINANSKGYRYGSVNGYGPGRGTGYGGGGHGGYGGRGNANAATYGSVTEPTDPGSGGGETGSTGYGGGVVRITANGDVTVNGTISADGGNGGAGGGSGGSIYVTCRAFYGTDGVVSAAGGWGSQQSGGGAGGGRIAVVYDPAVQSVLPTPMVRFSTAYGTHLSSKWTNLGDLGTLYFPDGALLDRALVTHSGQLYAPGLTNWSASALTVSNCAFRVMQEGVPLAVDGAIAIVGNNSYLHRLQLTDNPVTCGGSVVADGAGLFLYAGATSRPSLTCSGPLTLANAAVVHIFAGQTNATDVYGAEVTVVGDMRVPSGSRVYAHSYSTGGGSPLFRVGSLTIDAGGAMDAAAIGYGYGYGPGHGSSYGGGSYGGRGGGTTLGTYGSMEAPLYAGSGAGDGKSGGGGLIRVETARGITVNGTITADGAALQSGGSGGGIYLRCGNFSGTGTLSAKGGNANSEGGTYGGGGGRIAVWSTKNLSSLVSTNVVGGTHSGSYDSHAGAPGTIFWGFVPPGGTVFVVR